MPGGPAVADPVGPRVEAAPVVLAVDGARVVIARRPFRLTVQDAQGHTVLSEVPHATLDTQVEPPTMDPLPPGTDHQSTTTRYSPLSFLVGTEQLTQMPADEWIANLASGTRSGCPRVTRPVGGSWSPYAPRAAGRSG